MLFFENIVWLLVLIGVMILVHELGHFWVARFFDVRVETFSFGFGPRLFGFRRGETDFRFSAILFGGYVKMAGEQPGDENVNDPRAFLAKPRWQRLAIAFAGPLMNVALAVVLLTGLFMFKFPKPVAGDLKGVIGHVLPDSAAAKAGLREGDRIVHIDDIENPSWQDILIKEVSSANHSLMVTVERDGGRFATTVTPVLLERVGLGFAGWAQETKVQVGSLSPGLPAEKAGLQPGDLLISINGIPIRSIQKTYEVIGSTEGKPVEIECLRNGQRKKLTIQPVFTNVDGPARWMIGFLPEHRLVYTSLAFADALYQSVRQNLKGATLIYQVLKGLIERRMSPKSLDGPIGIARLSGEAPL
jgi:regulator of sigma E protease